METLEVGMYIRYVNMFKNNIKIDKIREISDNNTILTLENNITHKDSIIKASHNIINLIEVGDYVNGVEVEKITDNEIMLVDTHLYIDKNVANDLIKTILTKEQFENNCYKIGGE